MIKKSVSENYKLVQDGNVKYIFRPDISLVRYRILEVTSKKGSLLNLDSMETIKIRKME